MARPIAPVGRFAVILSMLSLLSSARGAETWEQTAQKQPTGGDAAAVPAVKKGLADWIWGPSDDGDYRLSKSFAGGAKKGAGNLPSTTAEKIAWCRSNDSNG